MNTAAAIFVLLLALPLPEARATMKVPDVDAPKEEKDPNFRRSPMNEDLATVVKYLGNCITDPVAPQASDIAGIDFFLSSLEKRLRKGNDVPRDRILRNADLAREHLRLAFNDLASAMAPERLPAVRKELKEVSDAMAPLLERNRKSVSLLESVASTARATAGAMAISPPDSPGEQVPVDSLSSIEPLRPELIALRERLKAVAKKLDQAKAFIKRAEETSSKVDGLADIAARLDKDALERLSERRTRGAPTKYRTTMQSREVILNANKWLKRAVEKAEEITRQMDAELDPKQEGLRKALAKAFEADAKTLDGKELETRSGNRINFNHGRRLNVDIEGVIRRGWEAASKERKAWWEGRARMAKSESEEDSGKMDDAYSKADQTAQRAETEAKAADTAVARIDESLGQSEEKLQPLDKRRLDVPAPHNPGGPGKAIVQNVKSKGLKIPHTLDVTNQEIMKSYDDGDKVPEGDGTPEDPATLPPDD